MINGYEAEQKMNITQEEKEYFSSNKSFRERMAKNYKEYEEELGHVGYEI